MPLRSDPSGKFPHFGAWRDRAPRVDRKVAGRADGLAPTGATDLLAILGVAVLTTGIVLGAVLATMTVRFARPKPGLIEPMAQAAFVPEKRRNYISLLAMERTRVLDTSIVWGLGSLGGIPAAIASIAIPVILLVGTMAVLGLTWLALRPTRLGARERARLGREATVLLQSLAMAPIGRARDLPPPD